MSRAAWLLLMSGLLACDRDSGGGAAAEQPVALRPKNAPTAPAAADAAPAPTQASGCPPLVVLVKPDGIWLRDASTQSVVALCGGEIDSAALGARLCAMARAAPPGCAAVEVAAESGVKYQQLIAVMDAAMAVGLRDVGLVDPGGLSLPLRDPRPSDRAAPACGDPVPGCPVAPPGGATATAPAPAGGPLTDAIVVVVPADGSVTLNGKKIATAAEAKAGDRIEPLYKELRAKMDPAGARALVLQVDRSIDARLVNRIVVTCQAAGYHNILFAVRNKNAPPAGP
jgi:biopolymer transport protein ExbD